MDNQDARQPDSARNTYDQDKLKVMLNPVTVVLSRKNLMTLLLKMDRCLNGERSACTIVKQDINDVNIPVVITAQEDAVVYADRTPERMIPAEEVEFVDPPNEGIVKDRRWQVDRRHEYPHGYLIPGVSEDRRTNIFDRRETRRPPSGDDNGFNVTGS
jgi:hypothetical protein